MSDSLYDYGILYSLKISRWSFRVKNTQIEFGVDDTFVQKRAITTFGTKLLGPKNVADAFQQRELMARKVLYDFGHYFSIADAYFIPWKNVEKVEGLLKIHKVEYEKLIENLLETYDEMRVSWMSVHSEIKADLYPNREHLRKRFKFIWHTLKVQGGDEAIPTNTTEALSERAQYELVRDNVKENMQDAINQFVSEYVDTFRQEVIGFCDHILEHNGAIHGKTVNRIGDAIERFSNMNIFGDDEVAHRLSELKTALLTAKGHCLTKEKNLVIATTIADKCAIIKDQIVEEIDKDTALSEPKRKISLD